MFIIKLYNAKNGAIRYCQGYAGKLKTSGLGECFLTDSIYDGEVAWFRTEYEAREALNKYISYIQANGYQATIVQL